MAPGCAGSCRPSGSAWWRSSVPAGGIVAGKSDRVDALLAAKRVLAGDGVSTPRADGNRSALSVLLVAYRSCVEERTRLLNQLQGLHVTAPASLRERIGHGNGARLADRLVRMRDRPGTSPQE